MADDPIELVRLRNNFYRDNYRRVLGLLLLAIITVIILTVSLIYIVIHPPAPKYFATDSQGRLVEMKALTQPNLASATLLQWTNQAVVSVFTYDFVNYRQQLQNSRDYFTSEGWSNFISALKSQNIIQFVLSKKMTVNAVATGAPTIVQEGILEGARYAWRIRMPILITYQSANQVAQQYAIATILVVRVSTLVNPKGVGIAQLLVENTNDIGS